MPTLRLTLQSQSAVERYTFLVHLARQLLLDATLNSAWANQNVVEACFALSEEELVRDLRISHKNILDTLRHILHGEKLWLDCLLTTADGGTWRLPIGPAAELPLEQIRQQWPEIARRSAAWLENQSERDLAAELTLQLPGEVEARFPRWRILRHVLDHSSLHRGQVIGMFRMLGRQPPAVSPMDYYLSNQNRPPNPNRPHR